MGSRLGVDIVQEFLHYPHFFLTPWNRLFDTYPDPLGNILEPLDYQKFKHLCLSEGHFGSSHHIRNQAWAMDTCTSWNCPHPLGLHFF